MRKLHAMRTFLVHAVLLVGDITAAGGQHQGGHQALLETEDGAKYLLTMDQEEEEEGYYDDHDGGAQLDFSTTETPQDYMALGVNSRLPFDFQLVKSGTRTPKKKRRGPSNRRLKRFKQGSLMAKAHQDFLARHRGRPSSRLTAAGHLASFRDRRGGVRGGGGGRGGSRGAGHTG